MYQASRMYYVMVGIEMSLFPEFESDIDFAQGLLSEVQVFVLPGQCFGIKNFFRVVICAPADVLKDSAKRIRNFVRKHINE